MGRYLDRLKKSENAQPGHHQNLQNRPEMGSVGFVGTAPARSQTPKRGSVGFVGTPVPRFENPKVAVPGSILDASSTADPAPANSESVAGGYLQNLQNPLPARLAIAAERACREIHGDSDDQVQTMLDDLASYPPDDWDSLADHFEAQLPPPPEAGRERITLIGDDRQFQMDVPTEHVAEFKARASVRFRLKDGGGGGSVLGEPGTPREELVADLRTRYGSRLETIDGAAP